MTKPHNEEYTPPRCEVLTLQLQGIIAGSVKNKEITDNDW